MAILIFLLLALECYSLLPGMTRKAYTEGDSINIFAGVLTSVETQLPFNYFYLPFCKTDYYELENENLGQALSGDVVEKTSYEITIGDSFQCKHLCSKRFASNEINNFLWMMGKNYRAT